MKRSLTLLLAFLMLIATLSSCKPNGQTPNTDTDMESESETESGLVFARKGERTKYKIVYADGSSELLISAVETVTRQINSVCDNPLMMCFSANAEWEKPTVDTPEILIGETNRAESIELQKSITEDYEYIIKAYPNGRIVIVASNEQMLIEAVEYFAETYVTAENDGYLSVPVDLYYTSKLSAEEAYGKYWRMSLPVYAAGVVSGTYNTGMGISMDVGSQTGRMQVVSKTTAEEFADYLKLLGEKGYEEKYRKEANGCTYVQYYYAARKRLVYAYFIEALGEARIIEDTNSMLIDDFSYTCADGEAAIYQYAMMTEYSAPYEANGMFYIIRSADNKLILVDGGSITQATEKAVVELLAFMREITGKTENEKIDISAIFVTHLHSDHYSMITRLMSDEKYYSQLNVERFMHNVPSWTEGSLSFSKVFPNMSFMKLHTGQSFTLGNVGFDVLFTHEDYVDPRTGRTIITEFNNTSTVLKVTLNGRSVIITGDWSGGEWTSAPPEFAEGQRRMLLMHTNDKTGYNALNADVIQFAHHAFNTYVGDIYKTVGAEYAFAPTHDAKNCNISGHRICVSQFIESGGNADKVYFQGRYTYCLSVSENGDITVAAENIRGVDKGDDPDTTNIVEKDYVNDILSKGTPYRIPTEQELANWAVIHS